MQEQVKNGPFSSVGPLQGQDLLGRPVAELRDWMVAAGEPAYRGAQLYHAIYAERRFDFGSMTNLPAALRARLGAEARLGMPQISRRYCSTDGAVRYLLSAPGGAPGGPPKGASEAGRAPARGAS
ncbi:MAG TPA: hypothetical protein VGG55_03005, partial [Candidatus Acidoferrales bacterium]